MKRQVQRRKGLLAYMHKLRRAAGVTHMAKVPEIVSALAGAPLSKSEAYKWLEDHRAMYSGAPARVRKEVIGAVARAVRPQGAPKKRGRAERVEFYNSEAWRKVRFGALKKADGCCALCGRNKRDHGVVLHVDHIKPRSLYPALELQAGNLQVLCEDCNLGKGNRDTTDWRLANVISLVQSTEAA